MDPDQLLKLFLERKQGSEIRSQLTVEAYETDIRLFYEFLEQQHLYNKFPDITSNMVDTWLGSMRIRTYSNDIVSEATKVRRLAALKSFFSFLEDEEIIQRNPIKKMKTKRDTSKKVEVPIFDVKEIVALIKICAKKRNAEEWTLMLSFLLTSGLRISEFLSVRVENLTLVNHRGEIKRKGGKIQPFVYSEQTRDMLEEYISKQKLEKDSLLFPYTYHNFYRQFKQLGREAGIDRSKIHPHTFRHTWTTDAVRLGWADELIRKYGGWTSTRMLGRYSHLTEAEEAELTKDIGKRFEKVEA